MDYLGCLSRWYTIRAHTGLLMLSNAIFDGWKRAIVEVNIV